MLCTSAVGNFPLTPNNLEYRRLFSFHFFRYHGHQRTSKRPVRIELSSSCRRRCTAQYTFASPAFLIRWLDEFESIEDVDTLSLVAVLKKVYYMTQISESLLIQLKFLSYQYRQFHIRLNSIF